MTEKIVEISIPLILHDHNDCDDCLEKIVEQLQSHKGIIRVHLHEDHDPVDVCIHYDPNLVSLAAVRRMAETTGAEISNRYQHDEIRFVGLTSADSAITLTKELEKMEGMLHASVSYTAGLAFLAYDDKSLTLNQIEHTMRRYGARPERTGDLLKDHEGEHEEHEHSHAPKFLPQWMQKRWDLILIALGGLLLLFGWVGERFLGWPALVTLGFFILSYLSSGYDTALHAIPALFRGKFDTDTLMLAAAVGAAILGEWAEGAFLLFLFGLGHAGENYALDKARNAINALGELMPKTARVRQGDQIVEVPVEQLAIDDVVIVRPGDRIPVDGVVILGDSTVDQSPITGESVPVQKSEQDEVFAGTINHEAALEVRVAHRPEDTTLSRVIKMVAEAQAQQSPTQQFTDRFTAWFVPIVLVLVVLVAVVPPLLGWLTFSDSFYRSMLLLVAASPCALAVGTPAAVLSGIARAARSGVLIKGGVHLENLGKLRVIAFDKTGTLTQGRFQVTDVIPMDGVNSDELLGIAAAVEQQSNHPLAQAIVHSAQEKNLNLPEANGLGNVPSQGIRSEVAGQSVWIGSLKLYEEGHEKEVDERLRHEVANLENQGRTTMIVSHNGTFLGIIALSDIPRPSVVSVLSHLRKLGIHRLIMLTGDNQSVADRVGWEVGVTEVKASLMPEDKLEMVKSLQKEYGAVAMVGDGVNDAPALATSTVGIAMGGAGTAVALETADVALMADDLSKLPFAVGLSRASRKIIQQNLAISLGVIGLLIVTSVAGMVELSAAVIFHEGSTVLVALNALRLLAYQIPNANS